VNATERRGEATLLPAELDGDVRGEHVHSGVGDGGRLRARRLGQHGQLRQADQHVRALRQVLPVHPGRRAVAGALAAPLVRRPPGTSQRRLSRPTSIACRQCVLLIAKVFWSPRNIQANSFFF
jgi:hypothetical protein